MRIWIWNAAKYKYRVQKNNFIKTVPFVQGQVVYKLSWWINMETSKGVSKKYQKILGKILRVISYLVKSYLW